MTTQIEKNLNDVFDIETEDTSENMSNSLIVSNENKNLPVNPSDLTEEEIENNEIKDQANEDYNLARQNIKDLIDRGNELLGTAIDIVNSTEDAKAIAGAAAVLKNLADINKSLIDMAKQKQDIYKNAKIKGIVSKELANASSQTNIQNITNNVVFNGSSSDLMKIIKQAKEENTIDAEQAEEIKEEDKELM